MPLRQVQERVVCGLTVTQWAGRGSTVLALAGLTSTGRAWGALADALPDARIVAPHLRGRGGSAGLGGASGLRAHAQDLARICAELDLQDLVVIGHSMGAYLAPIAAQELGERVSRLVLVDGGIPPQFPFFMTPTVVRALFRHNLRKADREWSDVETLIDRTLGKVLRERPDLRPALAELLSAEMAGPDASLRPRVDTEHAVADAIDTFFGKDLLPALEQLRVPAHLVCARWGKHDGARPFLAERVVQAWRLRLANLSSQRVQANHVTILFAPELAAAVAQ